MMQYTSSIPFAMLVIAGFHRLAVSQTVPCKSGYQQINSTCQDINECEEKVDTPPTCLEGWSCHNLPGRHICDCNPGTMRRKIDLLWVRRLDMLTERTAGSPDMQACVYPIPMTQRFELQYVEELANMSSEEYKNMTASLNEKILQSYNQSEISMYIVGLNIQGIIQGSVVLKYEVLAIDDKRVTPTALQSLYSLNIRNGYWNQTWVLPGIKVDSPQPAKPHCFRDTFQSRKVVGRTFSFPTATPGTTVQSEESCSKSGYSATIMCVLKTLVDGVKVGYYDTATMSENTCSSQSTLTVSELLTEVKRMPVDSSSMESAARIMNEISKTITSDSKDEIKILTRVLETMQTSVNDSDIDVSEDMLISVLSFMDNVYNATLTAGATDESLLDSDDRAKVVNAMDVFTNNLAFDGDTISFRSSSNTFQAVKVNNSDFRNVHFDEAFEPEDNGFQTRAASIIPQSVFAIHNNFSSNVIFNIYKDDTFFPPSSISNAKLNQILSLKLSKTKLSSLKEPILHSFGQPPRNKEQKMDFITRRCCFLDVNTGKWKFDGCTTTIEESGSTSCACDHTTNFAVITQTYAVPSSYALGILGDIGCVLSAVGLLIVLIIYLSFKKLRASQVNRIHINLCACLLVAYLTFLTGVERPRAYAPCLAVGVILQFSLLSAWGWMLTECVTMYKKFVRVFGGESSSYIWKAALIVYLLSLLATAITFTVAFVLGDMQQYKGWALDADNDPLFHPSYYVSDRLCWLHGSPLYYGFLTPIAVIFVLNMAGFIKISIILTRSNGKIRANKTKKDDAKDHMFRLVTMSILLGMCWVFAVPLVITSDPTINEIFSWLFSLTNAFQGLFIFLLYCVRRKDVRDMWLSRIPKLNIRKSQLHDVRAKATATTGISDDELESRSKVSSSNVTYSTLPVSKGGSPYLSPRGETNNEIALTKIQSGNTLKPHV